MRSNYLKTFRTAVIAVAILLLGACLAVAQQQVNLTAGPTSLTLPDGSSVPMWGYSCGAVVSGSTANCAALGKGTWSPVIITVPSGQDLQINLTNSLSFNSGATNIPTSLTIVGQVGAGLGTTATGTPSPTHTPGVATWPIAGSNPPAPGDPTFISPPQGPRVQSFSTEVAAGATTSLTWTAPRPGTYLLESGTHPSIQGPMGLYGMVVVTAAPSGGTAGTAYPNVSYGAEVPLLFSEIDPVQNNTVSVAVSKTGFSETTVWSGQPNGCGNPSSASYQTCYPPAVNYSPRYYLVNGQAFDRTNASNSLFAATPGSGATGNVLVRLVNAGLRMHVPSIVGSATGAAGASGFSLIAEDGNVLPDVARAAAAALPLNLRVQSEVFMAAGKTYDVAINVPAAGSAALPIYDRELSLSGNSVNRDAGMLAYIGVNGAALPSGVVAAAVAMPDAYSVTCQPSGACNALAISDVSKGVIANDVNVFGVNVSTAPTNGTLTLNANGTFTYTPTGTSWSSDTFSYQANGSGPIAKVTLSSAAAEGASGITCPSTITYNANTATYFAIKTPGVLVGCKDAAGYALTLDTTTVAATGMTVLADANGGFTATASGASGSFTFKAKNSQGTQALTATTVTVNFPTGSGLAVTVKDGADKTTVITDYRWIIEEDRTFYVNPNCTTNTSTPPAGCPTGIVPTFGTNFHTSYMPVVATGCTGPLSCESGQTLLGVKAVCDQGNGVCRTDATQETAVDPGAVPLDPNKRYYISVLPGDAANPFIGGNGSAPANCAIGAYDPSDPTGLNTACGHGMGGAPIGFGQGAVTIYTQPSPYPPAKLSVFVFEDDFPLNGEQDAGGGIDVIATNEPGLGQFQITLFDDAGGSGDATGQPTYDMFNMPLSNSLAGTIDPATQLDACPISANATTAQGVTGNLGITGMIVTCPKYESDGVTPSPLAGQAVIANMYPGRYGVVATPGADRIARGEEWLQTNTLDGQKAHDSFLRIGEPSFFQEFGPAGYHVSIGFANPAIINSRLAGVCNGSDSNVTGKNCTNSVTGLVTTERMSRTPDQRLYSSGDNSSFAFTQCYVSIGDPDGEDFAFTKCNADGTFTLSGLPDGDWRITVFDQWNDMLVDGLSTPVLLSGGKKVNMGDIAMNQWQANIYTSTFFDQNGDGVRQDTEPGLTLVPTNIRFRDGSFSNFNNTDLNGNAGFNEIFPLFSWYVIETDSTRYKNTGTHVVYDSGGPADNSPSCGGSGVAACGSSNIGNMLARTYEDLPVPGALHFPGAVYCTNADCTGQSIKDGPNNASTPNSTGRIDPPWVLSEGWQGFSGQNSFIEFGKTPYAVGENGGIRGHVIYASTRPFDDPQLLLQTSWEPLVPNVTINLYQEGTAADGSQTLTLVDTTKTSSFDDWAQGFRSDGNPNMNCPGQGRDTGADADIFFFTLYNQPMWLDAYNNGGTATHTIPNNSQFKCYDGMHNWNQVQPAPYDGMYQFPSIAGRDAVSGTALGGTGSVAGTNCTVCKANPTDGTPMLPAGKYVVEVVVPPGYELVKEEDKNILIGDNYIAPVTQEFAGLGNIFILPDQAEVGAAYNGNNAQNPTQDLGRTLFPSSEGDTGSVEVFWPCAGELRTVPDFISLFPQSGEVSPFAGASRRLCDRKEVTLDDQMSVLAKFYIFTSTHAAAHFTGVITDDFTSEFDPFSPQFGEKFSPPNLPISIKDWSGTEISRVYSDQWGTYNGLTYSTWEVNPPNPTGYGPTMMVTCMNDPGLDPAHPDPLYNPQYSDFCYEIPFMPGQTQYMDTPVVPTSAFAGAGYNNPDCNYPNLTPAISSVTSQDIAGPWVSAANHSLTITALGDKQVPNYGYSGPSATSSPYNQKTVLRHYGFGGSQGTVTIGGVSASITNWSDTSITVNVPNGVPACGINQQAVYGGSAARCGELVITAANGQQSVDTVTVTIGGKKPTVVTGQTIQSAIDAAAPGDMIIVPPGTYSELLIMWKPVRLQGVGAASSVINANTHPAGKLDPWRRSVNCLFGLALNGQPSTGNVTVSGGNVVPGSGGTNPFDSTGAYGCPNPATGANSQIGPNGNTWSYFYGGPNFPTMVVDRIPLEGILGWDATVNGNLAEQLQEPSLMGAYEGAGVTVLSKGVNIPAGSVDVFGSGAEAAFPAGTTLLGAGDCAFSSNFQCNPSSIDGLGITNSSQGGGGIFVHAWAHQLQVANNRVYGNAGTLSGGMSIGQGESPEAYLAPTDFGPGSSTPPGSCQNSLITNTQLPFCLNLNVNIHNNSITNNSSTGDELFSGTPAGAGGVSICTGADFYKFNFNWVCGNLSTGDGGGVGHLGFSYNGDIEHNTFLFNQSTNPTIATNGGGLMVMGAAPDTTLPNGIECGSVTDNDCVPGLSDGTGPGLVINANLFVGNGAESGSGGGLRFQAVNGTDVARFPRSPNNWYSANVTNNVFANNVAGWDGAGVSLEDALVVNFINNTVASNDSTASSGVLFDTLGAPLASSQSPPPNCAGQASGTGSCAQVAGLVVLPNSPQLTSSLPATITCPANHFKPGTSATNGSCRTISYPQLWNNAFWQNRTFYIGVGSLGTGTQNQQNVVSLFNSFTNTGAVSQPPVDATSANGNGSIVTGGTGACVTASYWDIGVRGDTGPNNPGVAGRTLAPSYSVLTDITSYGGLHNTAGNPTFVSQYCNGSRVPPENGGLGYQVPPGISDATVPNPIFSLTPAATVDEGNNWINISWGPLALAHPVTGAALGNYGPTAGSSVVNLVPNGTPNFSQAPGLDFFGNPRKTNGAVDAGAIEFQGNNTLPQLSSIVPNNGARGTNVAVTLSGTNLANPTSVNVSGAGVTVTGVSANAAGTQITATFQIASNALLTARNVSVTTGTGTSNNVTFTIMNPPQPTVTSVSPNAGVRGTSVAVTITGTNFTTNGGDIVTVGGGVGVVGVTVVNSTTITATFNIASVPGLGARNVQVTTPGGTSAINAGDVFTVQGATVSVSAPAPSMITGVANTTVKNSIITVSNAAAATAPLTLTAAPTIVVTTAGAGSFSITGGTCVNGAIINPGSNCTINVRYTPTGTATSTAHVSLANTGASANPFNGPNFNAN